MALSISIVSCSGEDGATGSQGIPGEQGEKGDTGAQGEQGDPGEPGQDGADGVGFDELTQYGYITLEMEGTRSDNQVFQDSTAFKFTPIELDGYSNMTTADDILYTFEMRRFLSAPDDVYQNSYIEFELDIANIGQEDQAFADMYFNLSNYAVIGDDNKYFVLNINDLSLYNQEIVSDVEVTGITYDTETNQLSFSYAFTLNAGLNSPNPTGNPISMSGMADVQLLSEVIAP